MSNVTTPCPTIQAAPVGSLGIGETPAPVLYEIRWTDGTVTGPFVSQDEAVEFALDINQRFDISADLEIMSPAASRPVGSYREGEIREVGDDR